MYLPGGRYFIRHLYIYIHHHPYIDSTTVLSDTIQVCKMVVMNIIRLNFNLTLAIASLPKVGSKFRVESQIERHPRQSFCEIVYAHQSTIALDPFTTYRVIVLHSKRTALIALSWLLAETSSCTTAKLVEKAATLHKNR